jgi:esterase/lipase
MDELAVEFNGAGYSVFRPAFTGHCGNNRYYLDVEPADWERDAREFHSEAAAKAGRLGVPLFLAAYSFSAAIYQALAEELPFARRIYLAPAISTRFWYPAAILIANAFPRVTYHSMNLGGYYANEVSGMKAVQALEYFVRKVRRKRREGDRTPTLVLVDPKDELVSYKGIRIVAGRRKTWRVGKLSNRGSRMRPAYHHLIVTEESLGAREWRRMIGECVEFLKG